MSERFLRRLAEDRREIDHGRSIAEHLQLLLNEREGLSATNPDFGLPDLTDVVHTFPNGVQSIESAIRDVIVKYEPRLSKVKVRSIESDDAFVLYFDISARQNDAKKSPFRVRTALHPGNRFQVGS